MALPQTIDPSTLNLSGRPAMATTTAPSTTTSAGSPGYAMPRVEDVKNEVPPALGALFGGMLGYAAENRGSAGSKSGNANANAPGGNSNANPLGSILSNLIKNAGKPSTTPGSTPTGDIGNVNSIKFPAGTTQETIDAQYGKTNGQSNVVISGVNPGDGQVIATPNYDIGGGNLSGNGSATGNQTEPGGGGYDPNVPDTEQYYTNDNGDIYDYAGDLMFAYNNGYYMDPTDYSMYDATTFDPVDGQSVYANFFDIPVFDSSGTTSLDGYDFSNYSPADWGSFYVKNGGSINKSGLPTPLFANGGGVRGYADGSLIEAATAMAPSSSLGSSPVTTAASTSSTGTDTSSFGDLINGLLSNKTLTGAGLGAILTSLINSNSTQPVNKGVDMTALGTLKPRTTPVGGPAKFVPYSEYGTPTAPYDYSALYNNLGVSPFGGSTGAAAPTLSPTAPGATPTTPTAPVTTSTGGLPTTTSPTIPTAPTGTTPVTPAAPLYFTDDDGNIYDADGNLVYDSTTSTAVASTGAAASPVAPSASPLAAASTLAPTSSGDSYYSYGTAVTPSSVLGAKKGGSIKMADGGSSGLAVSSTASPSDSLGGLAYNDLQSGWNQDDLLKAIRSFYPDNLSPWLQPGQTEDDYINSVARQYDGLTGTPIRLRSYNQQPDGGFQLGLDPNNTQYIPSDFYAQNDSTTPTTTPIYDLVKDTPLPYERNDVSVTSTGTDFPPVMYNQGMPEQRQDLMPTQGPAMPTQGPAMPQQTPFSSSPTFRYSGANNPLLTGLRQPTPGQQPFMLMPDGTFAPREEISTSRQYADGGYVPPPNFSSAAAQLAYSSSMRDPSIPYSSGVVSTPGTVTRGGYRPPSARPVTPTMPAQNNNYLNSQYLNTWQKSFPGYRAPALDGKGYIGGPGTVGPFSMYGKPFAEGGDIGENIPYQTNLHIPQIDGRNDYREGGNYVEGPGDGQSDDIPAMLADGEYVIDAETVAQLGNGSNKAGARILDEFRENIRSHKRSAPTHKIPPKSKSALAYLKGAK
jgi:hypothetical protein